MLAQTVLNDNSKKELNKSKEDSKITLKLQGDTSKIKVKNPTLDYSNGKNESDYYSLPKYRNHTLEHTFDYSDERIGDYAQNIINDNSMMTYNENNMTSITTLANEYFHNASSLEMLSDEQNSVISSENDMDVKQLKPKGSLEAAGTHKALPSYSSKNSSIKKIILQKKCLVSQNRRRTPKINSSLSNYHSYMNNKTMCSDKYFKVSDSSMM